MKNDFIVKELINAIQFDNKYLEESKKSLIEHYTVTRLNDLKKLKQERIIKHNFIKEVEIGCERLFKISIIKNGTIGIETHKYSPELNRLILKNGSIYPLKSNITTIQNAYIYIAMHETLKNIKSNFDINAMSVRKIFGEKKYIKLNSASSIINYFNKNLLDNKSKGAFIVKFPDKNGCIVEWERIGKWLKVLKIDGISAGFPEGLYDHEFNARLKVIFKDILK